MHPTRPRVLLCPDGRGALWEAEVNEHGTGGTARMLMEERKHRWISVELVPPACDVGYAVVMNEVGNQNAGCSLFRIHGLGGDAPVLEQPAVIPDSPWMRSAIEAFSSSPASTSSASSSSSSPPPFFSGDFSFSSWMPAACAILISAGAHGLS